MEAGVLKGKQGSALGFELVDEPSGGVGKENVPQCIDGKCYGLIEFARTFSLVFPCAEEFEWWRRLRFRRRVGSPCARRGKQCDEQGNQQGPPLPIGGTQFSRAQRFRFENRPTPPEESYHARSKRFSRSQEISCRKEGSSRIAGAISHANGRARYICHFGMESAGTGFFESARVCFLHRRFSLLSAEGHRAVDEENDNHWINRVAKANLRMCDVID